MKTERKPTWWKWDGKLRPSRPSRGYEDVPRISDDVHAAISACGNDDENLPAELQAQADEQIAAGREAIRARLGLPPAGTEEDV